MYTCSSCNPQMRNGATASQIALQSWNSFFTETQFPDSLKRANIDSYASYSRPITLLTKRRIKELEKYSLGKRCIILIYYTLVFVVVAIVRMALRHFLAQESCRRVKAKRKATSLQTSAKNIVEVE